tara:strand:- start:7270 stop:7392 length:123 start_codon:yes stop_codon:yes gene_type:complete
MRRKLSIKRRKINASKKTIIAAGIIQINMVIGLTLPRFDE